MNQDSCARDLTFKTGVLFYDTYKFNRKRSGNHFSFIFTKAEGGSTTWSRYQVQKIWKECEIQSRRYLGVSKSKHLSKTTRSLNKKRGSTNETPRNEINMINTNINDELQKYLDVLKSINPNIKQYRGGYMATCPNTDAHNWKRNKTTPTNNFQIEIQKTNDENRDKFGDEMVVYRCHAHGDGPCSNDKLAKIFKEHGIQVPKHKKGIIPDVFPVGDDSYLNVNRISERPMYFYRGLSKDTYFLETHIVDKKTGKRKILPLSYSKFATEHKDLHGKGGWVEANLWHDNRPLYDMDKIGETKKNKCILVHETHNVKEAEGLFSDYFITTYTGGAKSWDKSCIEMLVRFNEVICFPKNTPTCKKAFKDVALYLKDRGIKARLVNLSSEFPLDWNFDQQIPKDIDLYELIDSATIPKHREVNDYSNLDEDIVQGRWTHLEDSRRYHYDHFKKKIAHNDNINLWYENDTSTRRDRRLTAIKYMHREGCDRAQGLAFRPTNEVEIYDEKGNKYINSYIAFKHKEFSQDELDTIDLSPFFLQLDIVCNFDKQVKDHFLDIIAFTIQKPVENLKFAVLVVSQETGTGKTNLWKCIEKMHGGTDYSMWVDPQQLTSKLGKSWLKESINIFCNEVRVEGTRSQKKVQIDILKSLITEDTHTIEPKGVDPYQIKNNFNCWFSSNEDVQELVESETNRRYFVVNCPFSVEEIESEYPTIFDDMVKFVDDNDKIARLYHYFKHEHKISKDFKAWRPLITEAKRNMVRAIRSQLFKNLDEIRVNKRGPFQKDFANTRMVYEHCIKQDQEYGTKLYSDINEQKINEYFLSIGKRYKKGEPVNLDGTRKRGWFITRNIPEWEKQNLTNARLHMEGKFDLPDFKNKQEELPLNAPTGATLNDKEKRVVNEK